MYAQHYLSGRTVLEWGSDEPLTVLGWIPRSAGIIVVAGPDGQERTVGERRLRSPDEPDRGWKWGDRETVLYPRVAERVSDYGISLVGSRPHPTMPEVIILTHRVPVCDTCGEWFDSLRGVKHHIQEHRQAVTL